ncbi:DNA-binding response regulator [Arcobacter sp. CECT 8989]|uniref:response regulator transcription factor n=1 Tax=Arcobacter sp. CECT 8989 TaxID=2044509 RepID=UPI00100B1AB2|nr:response regulator transcription factor [Arcobacter sp. CECT 8989]RXK01774.1 DNA-binding response regulator [Arcobacter sp. CECT 8989]
MKEITKYLNILIVEDDIEIQNNLKKTLSLLFNQVFIANDGVEALKSYKELEVDIIISDYVMPNMDGYELSKKIREEKDDIPIIILSSFMDIEKLQKCIPLELTNFLEKPIAFDKLLEQINISIEKLEKTNRLKFKITETITYCKKKKCLLIDNNELELSLYESKLLELLCDYKNQIIEFDTIIGFLSNKNEEISKNSVKNIVYRLRKKLPIDLITAHRNLGYSINI